MTIALFTKGRNTPSGAVYKSGLSETTSQTKDCDNHPKSTIETSKCGNTTTPEKPRNFSTKTDTNGTLPYPDKDTRNIRLKKPIQTIWTDERSGYSSGQATTTSYTT